MSIMNASTLRIDFSFQPDGSAVASARTVEVHLDDATEWLLGIAVIFILALIGVILSAWREAVTNMVMMAYGVLISAILLRITVTCLVEENCGIPQRQPCRR